ncbi:hypothetical protein F53441_14509 [Fusarium austroafricanum]|uniref:Uncharacterized protein n=1 Tax=Fusarium austroafricanum TaxID=2364996 RepID=A0A8H4NC49_9HYPO|nr:hypothetical protein F53441_14509 [Fusarium austroafricanum]
MALVLSRLGLLVSGGFTVSETASALTVGKLVGSVVSRHADAGIFDAFVQQYGVRLTALPPWLEDIQFDRSGMILGSQLREIPCQNTIFDVKLRTVEGIATFIVLVARYVESRQQLAKYVENLIRGKYYIVSGGDLETREKNDLEPVAMPYSSRMLMQNFVNAVIDSDARSPQHDRCRQLLGELTNVVGSAAFQEQTSRHARAQCQKLLQQFLGRRTSITGKPDNIFNTLSAAAAMIALAAMANGAHVRVICQTSSGSVEIPQGGRTFYSPSVFTVILWLTEPPAILASELSMVGEGNELPLYDSDPKHIPIYGGAAEISRAVVLQTGCKLPDDLAMEIWERAVQEGSLASWEVWEPHSLRFRLTEEALCCEVPDHIAHLADGLYGEGDRRRKISRKAAAILHDVANYSEYEAFGDAWFNITITYTMIAYSIGCLRSVVSVGGGLLSQYCWTTDCELNSNGTRDVLTSEKVDVLSFIFMIATTGATIQDFLWRIACVWGGSTSEYHNHVEIHDRVFGIVSPHLTFLSDVLRDPKELARNGLSKGFISVLAGSIPILPRDPLSGLVIAADSSALMERGFIFNKGPRPLSKETTDGVLFSVEPYTGQEGALCAVICTWQFGEILLELDPMRVHDNLLARRSLSSYEPAQVRTPFYPNHCFVPLYRAEIPVLGSFFMGADWGRNSSCGRLTAILRAEGRPDWQVVAAGAVEGGEMVMACAEESLEELLTRDPSKDFSEVLIVACRNGVLSQDYIDLIDRQKGLASKQSETEFYCIEFNVDKLERGDSGQFNSAWSIRKGSLGQGKKLVKYS